MENNVHTEKPYAPPSLSSKKAVINFPIMYSLYYLIRKVSTVINRGSLIALTNYFINFVNTPGAGAQPNGSPTH